MAGLLLAQNPTLSRNLTTPIKLKRLIREGVDPLGLPLITGGRINAHKSLGLFLTTIASPTGRATRTSPIPINVIFSRPVTGFEVADITITNGAITVNSFHAYPCGRVYRFTVTPTTEGLVTVNVPANVTTDLAGNPNPAAPAFSIRFDTLPPIAPTTLAVTNGTINLVNVDAVVVTGTAEAGSTVKARLTDTAPTPNVVTATGLAHATTGVFSITLNATTLVDGNISVDARATDVARNIGPWSTAITVIKDTLPPVAINPVTSPTNITSQTITGTRDLGKTITVTVNTAAVVGTITYPDATTWSVSITGLVGGPNIITATTTPDAAGNVGNATATIVLDTIVPQITEIVAGGLTHISSNWLPVHVFDANPAFANIDGDADLDLAVGNWAGLVHFFRNDGTAADPTWVDASSNWLPVDVGNEANPAFADIDADGDFDLAVGNWDGVVNFFRNDGTAAVPTWTHISSNWLPVDVGTDARPAFINVDGDLDLDLAVGNEAGFVHFFQNTGSAAVPTWAHISSNWLPVNVGWEANPAFVNVDGDADLDLAVGNGAGFVYFFRNDGTAAAPTWTHISSNWLLIDIGADANPAFADIDADGDFDLVVGNTAGFIGYFRNDLLLGITNISPIPMKVIFSEAVIGFIEADITLTNGIITAGSFISLSGGQAYRFTVTPSGTGLRDISVTVNVPANVTTDLAGNPNPAAPAFSIRFDTLPPIAPTTLAVTNGTINLVNVDAVVVTGTAEAGSTVKARLTDTAPTPNVVTATGLAHATTGVFSITLNATTLVDGNISVDAKATDVARNIGPWSTAITVIKDTLPPVAINPVTSPTNINSQTITGTRDSGKTITVTINIPATVGIIEYPTDTTWSVPITGLVEGPNIITATTTPDAAGNVGNATATIVLVSPRIIHPPVISDIRVIDITHKSAIVHWTTNKPSSSRVEFGPTPAYVYIIEGIGVTTNHKITLPDLDSDTQYHFRVISFYQGRMTASDNQTFKTSVKPVVAPPVVVPPIIDPPVAPPVVVPPEVEPDNQVVLRQELLTQIEELTVLIRQIEAQIKERQLERERIIEPEIPVVPEILTGFIFERNLRLRMTHPNVRKLQIFLNLHPQTRLAETGPGSPGRESTLFGHLTHNALIRFQEKHRAEILTPAGLERGTGFLGPRTRAKINEMIR